MKTLNQKIDYSIALMQRGERLALNLQPAQGYALGFSGGKDSQALLILAKMAGVRFTPTHNVTTIDYADNIRFIKHNYPEVRLSVPPESFLTLVERKGLPTRMYRWCCAIFKEKYGAGSAVLTGVRREESRTRSQYAEVYHVHRDSFQQKDLAQMEEVNFSCIKGKDRVMVSPMLEWTAEDVWQFLKDNGAPINPLYQTKRRVGCRFCPFAPRKELRATPTEVPRLYHALLRHLQVYLDNHANQFDDAAEFWRWWVSGDSVNDYLAKKRQLSLFNE